jgi:hypothetical protein
MEEFYYLNGEYVPLEDAADIMGITVEELINSKNYLSIDLEDPYSE